MARYSSPLPPIDVGGQAVLEGVMMRSPRSFCIAVRRPSGEIVVREDVWRSIWDKVPWLKFLRKPGFRGVIIFLEALVNGLQALSFSAKWAYEDEKSDEKLSDWALAGTMIVAFALGIGLFVAVPHLLTWGLGEWTGGDVEGKTLSFHLVDGAIKMTLFISYLYLISKMKDIRRVFQYHGAEHKAIYAYEMGEPLTVEAAARHTTLHPRCGTSFLLNVILISILLFSVVFPFMPSFTESKLLNHVLLVFIKIPMMLPVAAMAYEVNRWASKRMESPAVRALVWPGLMMQKITTQEPSREQLEIALTALRYSLWREKVGVESLRVRKPEEVQLFKSYDDVAAQVPV
jgi:uncharacterized protein YqhQ